MATNEEQNIEILLDKFSDVFAPEETEYYGGLYTRLLDTNQDAYAVTVNTILKAGHIYRYNVSFDDIVNNPMEYVAAMPQQEIVQAVYNNEDINTDIQDALNSGSASALEVINDSLNSGELSYEPNSTQILPDAGLQVAGLEDAQLDFITSMYIASFSRAPDAEGLMYWGDKAVEIMDDEGLDFRAAAESINTGFYEGGKVNNEAGTDLDAVGFATTAYSNLLGREPDESGLEFWADKIASGEVHRGDFLSYFIDGAMASDADSSHIDRLVTASEFMATDEVSGQGVNVDIQLLESVTDIRSESDAAASILEVINDYGQPDGANIDLAGLQEIANTPDIA